MAAATTTTAPASASADVFRFLDLPTETRVMIYQYSAATLTVHIRPRHCSRSSGLLVEGQTYSTLTNCKFLCLSKRIRTEAQPNIQISPTIQICRSAVAECGNAERLTELLHGNPDLESPTAAMHQEPSSSSTSTTPKSRPPTCLVHYSPVHRLLVTNRDMIMHYFRAGFCAMGEVDCLFSANRWVGAIEPSRSKHCEGKESGVCDRATCRRPSWCPKGIDFRQPLECLDRTEIVDLLMYILLSAFKDTLAESQGKQGGHGCTERRLELEITYRLRELSNPNSHEILEEMFHVRRMIEWRDIGERVMVTVGVARNRRRSTDEGFQQ